MKTPTSNTSYTYKDTPIQLIKINEYNQFETTIEGSDFLNSLKDKQLSIISLAGPYRSGKSFLANQIMNSMSGFRIGSTINACTKGLWVWGRPIRIDEEKEEGNTYMIIIDSEGLGSIEKDRELNIDMKIFTLCVLISSVIVYNTKSSITEDKIEALSEAVKMINRVKYTYKEEGKDSLLFDSFPKLIWVLRDFSLDLKEMSSNEYLEKALSLSNSSEDESKRHCREVIKRTFKERECVTLVIPSVDTKIVKNLEYEKKENIRKEFVEQVNDLLIKIKKDRKVKIVNGERIDGILLFGLILEYIESLNNNQLPIILSSLENVIFSNTNKVIDQCLELFHQNFLYNEIRNVNENGNLYMSKTKIELPINSNQLINNYFLISKHVIEHLLSHISYNLTPNQIGKVLTTLQSKIEHEYLEAKLENSNLLSLWIDEEIKDIMTWMATDELSFDGIKSIEDLNKAVFQLTNKLLNEFNTKLNTFPDVFLSNQIQKVINSLEQLIFEKIKNLINTVSEVVNKEKDSFKDKIIQLEKEIIGLKSSLSQQKSLNNERTKEKNEIYFSKLDLETKFDLLSREMKNKEKEITSLLQLENEKYLKMEEYYLSVVKEKNLLICEEERKVKDLTRQVNLKEEDLNLKQIENKMKVTKLSHEIEKMTLMKENDYSTSISIYDESIKDEYSQLFKKFQFVYGEFKEIISKSDKEKESLYKNKYFEISNKQLDKKNSFILDDMSMFRDEQIKLIKKKYDETVVLLKKDVQEYKLKLDQCNYHINEEKIVCEALKQRVLSYKVQIDELKGIVKSKDCIVSIQKEQIAMYEKRNDEFKVVKEDLEFKICEYVSNAKFKEDELETVVYIVDAILERNKVKFESYIFRYD